MVLHASRNTEQSNHREHSVFWVCRVWIRKCLNLVADILWCICMWHCLCSTRTAGISFDDSHKGQMGQESFLCSHLLGLLHPVQDVWGNSQPAVEGWGLLGLHHSCFLLHLNMFPGSKILPWMNTGIFLSGVHFLRNSNYSWYTSTFFEMQIPKLVAVPPCSFDFSISKGQILSEDSLHGGKPCCLGNTEDEQGARDIQCFLAVMLISS